MKNKIIEKLFNLAYTDSMTELKNRNAYEEHLKKLRRERTILTNITVAVIDINDLKQINDIYGHHTGDEAIRTVANILKKTIGEQAYIYRVGGDEFVCISEKNILAHIAKFMDFISFENKDRYYKVDVALGYGIFNPNKHKTIDDLIKSCDKKMYADKRNKRKV